MKTMILILIVLNSETILDTIIRLPGSSVTIPAPGHQVSTKAIRDWISRRVSDVSASLNSNIVKDQCGLHRLPENALVFQALRGKKLDDFLSNILAINTEHGKHRGIGGGR